MAEAVLEQKKITRKPGAFEKRIHEVDFLRGVLMVLVIMDHLFWCLKAYNYRWWVATGMSVDLYYNVFKIFNFYWTNPIREVVRLFALCGFCFLSGISTVFSRNNWVRAGQMLLVYGIIAVGSNLLDASGIMGDQVMSIDFNVIGVLAWSTLFYCFAQNKTWRSILVGVLLTFLMCWYVVPWLSGTPMGEAYAPALWKPPFQGDWMPLFPFAFVFFLGAIFSYFIYAPTKQSIIKHRGEWERPICFLGRHTLVVYLGHQFVFIPFFMLISLFIR